MTSQHIVYMSYVPDAHTRPIVQDLNKLFGKQGITLYDGTNITKKSELVQKIRMADCVITLISEKWFEARRPPIEMRCAVEVNKLIFPLVISGNKVPDGDYIDVRRIGDFTLLVAAITDDLNERKPHDPFAVLDHQPSHSTGTASLWRAADGGPSNFVLGLVGMVIIVLAMLIAVFNLNSPTPGINAPDGWRVYDTSHVLFSLPQDWEISEQEKITASGIIYGSFIKRHTTHFLRISSVPRNKIENFAQVMAFHAGEMPDYTLIRSEVLSLPAGETLKLTMRGGYRQYLFIYSTLHGNRLHNVMLRVSEEDWPRIESAINSFLQNYIIKA